MAKRIWSSNVVLDMVKSFKSSRIFIFFKIISTHFRRQNWNVEISSQKIIAIDFVG